MATQVTLNSGSVDSAGSLALKTNGTTTAVTINASQGVEFNAGTAAAPTITTTGDTNTGIFFPAADTIAFSEGGVESMRIDSSGNVGIGSTPSAWNSGYKVIDLSTWGSIAIDFSTQGSTTVATNCFANSTGYDNWTFKNTAWATRYKQNDGIHSWLTSTASGTAGNAVTFAERMRIDTSGNLLVGATVGGGFTVFYAATDCIISRSGAAAGNATSLFVGRYSATSSTSGTLCFNVTTNGNVTNANNSYGSLSDVKLKENIVDVSPKLADLMQVRIVNYNFKEGQTHKQIGVVAQELEQVFPSMIEENSDYEEVTTTDEDGNETTERVATGTTTKSVKYSVFVPMLIKAIQEQQAIITQLQADVAALKAQP